MAMHRSVKRSNQGAALERRPAVRIKPLVACMHMLLAGGLLTAPLVHADPLPQVRPGGRWTGALDPRITNGGLDMVIDQTTKAATLEWQKFDIDANYSVRFNQPSADSVALNRIFDNAPSQINGRLTANGQIYLVNRNGIVFGDHAQVDVNTLIASTLNIDDSVFEDGILGAIQNGQAAFVADADMPANATIELKQGAQLSAIQGDAGRILILAPNIINRGNIHTPDGQAVLAASTDSVYLAQSGDPNLRGVLVEVKTGGNIDNLGSIIAERGNVSLLGMSVNQGGLVRATSTVSLNGSIRLVAGQSPSGLPSIGNAQVSKGFFYDESGGTLTLGSGSVTEVVPEGATTATDGQAQSKSYVDMAARNVTLESGARVTVTGGDVNILAKADPKNAFYGENDLPASDVGVRIESGAVIDVSGDTSTLVSVSRNVVAVEARGNELADSPLQRDGVIRNQKLYIDVRTGTPFLNSAGAQGLIERGVGERLAEGGNITLQSTGDVVVENGATLDIRGGRVTYMGDSIFTSKLVTEDGRVFDISAADPNRTYIGVLGQDLVIDHAKWGVSQIFNGTGGQYEAGYVEGKDAGELLIQTRRLAFNGALLAGSVAGDLQRLAPLALAADTLRPYDQRPQGGSFNIDLSSTAADTAVIFGADATRLEDPERGQSLPDGRSTVLSADMLNHSGVSNIAVDTTGHITVAAALILPDNGALSLKAGRIDVEKDIHIAGGDVGMSVAKGTGLGSSGNGIVVPSADVGLQVAEGVRIDVSGRWTNDSPSQNPGLPTSSIVNQGGSIDLSSGGDLVLGQGSLLDVSAGAQLQADGKLIAGAGGSIALASTDNLASTPSALSIGAQLRGYAFENGGSLRLAANEFLIADQTHLNALLLETRVDGSSRYQLSGTGTVRSLQDMETGEQSLVVDPLLFQSGGFDHFALTATRGGLDVAAGTHIELDIQNRLIDAGTLARFIATNAGLLRGSLERGNGSVFENVPTGTALDAFTRIGTLPDYLRGAVDLTLASENRFNYSINQNYPILNIGTDTEVLGRPGANVALASDTDLLLDGSIRTPAGSISLTLDSSFEGYTPQQMIYLGAHAELSAPGAVISEPNDLGQRMGQVLDAGTVDIRANLGSIVTAAGSRIAVDGVASTLDLQTVGMGIVARQVAGRAGHISLTAAESMLLQGDLSGRAALPAAAGGELSVALDPTSRTSEEEEIAGDGIPFNLRFPNDPRIINLAGYTDVLPAPGTALSPSVAGQAFLPVEKINQGGFDTLELTAQAPGSLNKADGLQSNGIIRFVGDTDLALRTRIVLDAPTLSTTSADVNLSAAYVAIGSTDTRFRLDGAPTASGDAVNLEPNSGDGTLRVNADLIDLVGDTVLQGFGNSVTGARPAVDLVSRGDIRLRGVRPVNTIDWNGSLRSAGDLRLQAQQIYPTTLSHFELAVESSGGAIDILGQSGTPGAPLSVGGSVIFSADNITVRNGAVVRAPIGEIQLTGTSKNASGAAVGAHNIVLEGGSLLSASAAGLSIPFGFTQFQKDLVLPVPGEDKTLQFVVDPSAPIEKALPEKRILLTGDVIDIQPGAKFDLSGGGDVRATEFIPGPGGSKDILLADLDIGDGVIANGSFAIVPNLGGAFAPFDPIESPAAQNIQGIRIGDTLILEEGTNGLPAGEYAVLPARYALFGGYLVTPVSGTQDMLAGQNSARLDGTKILAGRMGVAGTDITDSRTQGFAVEDGARVRLRAEYAETSLDALFTDTAVRTARDAGNLTINAGEALRLAGSLVPTATGGRGSAVDIIANELSILNHANGGSGVELLASDLAGLNADSLLIGATRSLTADAVRLNPGATRIDVASGVNLDVRELILVADQLNLGDGTTATRLSASGTANGKADHLIVAGNAALAMVSTAKGATLSREDGTSSASLNVAEGVTLTSNGSMVLDANGDVNLNGTLVADGGTLALGGASVSLGETDGRGLTGLVLSNADLARLAGSDLSLRSSNTVDIYGALDNTTATTYQFDRLAIDAKGIVGHDNTGAVARLTATEIELRNRSAETAVSVAGTDAVLELRAQTITLDKGDFNIGGYTQTRLQADAAILARDSGALDVAGDLNLDAPVLTATGGAERAITASDALTVERTLIQTALPGSVGLGARIELEGDSIDFAGNAVLPSGEFVMTSTGDISLGTGANIDVAGRDEIFASAVVGTMGGSIQTRSLSGSITVHEGVTLDVSGAASGGDAGRIEFIAPQGTLAIAPAAVLRAADSGENKGEFVVDVASLASVDATVGNLLSPLNQQLEAGGFRGRRDLRLRNGDLQLELGQVMHAHDVKLTADTGHLVIDGNIDASGSDGGSIVLAAGDMLDVNGTLDAHATAADGNGGRIELAALDADGDAAAHNDVVNLNAGSVLDLRGGTNGNGGSVLVRGLVYDANTDGSTDTVAVGALDATVIGAARADVEAVHAVTEVDGVITDTERDTWRNTLDQFMDNVVASLPASWRLLPGLEVSSAGDLTLPTVWDLYANLDDTDLINDWRVGAGNDIPGILTLRAAGHVNLNDSLTDGFKRDEFTFAGTPIAYDRLGVGESWRYRIVAGADRTSADVLATSRTTQGNIVVASGRQLRTGTGDIELAASGDVDISQSAAIYTAGLNAGLGPLASLDVNLDSLFNIVFFPEFEIRPATGEEFLLAYLNKGQFPLQGGDIRINAGGNLIGQAAQTNVTDWQPRLGGDFNINQGLHFENLPTHWAIAFENFKDGIGTLGGGDVTARIGGDVRDVAIALPTTGKPETAEVLTNDGSALIFAANQPTPHVYGGGDLDLEVAGNLQGGVLQIDRGTARVSVNGDFGTISSAQQPYFAIADTQLELIARGNVNLGGIVNATALGQTANMATAGAVNSTLAGVYDPLFFTYTDGAQANVTSLTGAVSFRDITALRGGGFGLYAPTLRVRSLQNEISIEGELQTFPSPLGQLELLADGDIRQASVLNSQDRLIQSDADAAMLPSMRDPIIVTADEDGTDVIRLQFLTPPGTSTDTRNGRRFHAANPVHQDDPLANLIVSRDGSIIGKSNPLALWELLLAKRTLVSAGQDIRNMSFSIQHVRESDLSLIDAQGDIVQTLSRNTTNGSFTASTKKFEIAGPGRLDLLAGGDIDLGTSQGVISIGDTANPALSDTGADVVLMSGLGQGMDYDAFIQTYLEDSAQYLNDLNAFLTARSIDAVGDPVGMFRSLSRLEQRELVLNIFFNELKQSGSAAETSGSKDYSRGFAAIASLFPSAPTGVGNISTPVSVIKTVDGGTIDMLAPYGAINAGATFRAIEKKSDELGVITGRGGDINVFLDGDLQVNRERVFALQGDLLAWSSNGSIDAGKGAKTVVSVPDPIVTVDANGNTIVTFPPAVDGSGLSASGNAYLFAPRGSINAGDAGIRVQGDLIIGAVEVLGADNIDVGGSSVGVPLAASGVDVGAVDAGSLSTSATSLAEDSTSSLGGDGEEGAGETLGMLSIELLGFGETDASSADDDERKRAQ